MPKGYLDITTVPKFSETCSFMMFHILKFLRIKLM